MIARTETSPLIVRAFTNRGFAMLQKCSTPFSTYPLTKQNINSRLARKILTSLKRMPLTVTVLYTGLELNLDPNMTFIQLVLWMNIARYNFTVSNSIIQSDPKCSAQIR